jgi:hypothetical protein
MTNVGRHWNQLLQELTEWEALGKDFIESKHYSDGAPAKVLL